MANTFEELQKAIIVRYDSDVWLSANTSGLFFGRVPENVEYPFTAYFIETTTNRLTSGFTETVRLQFSVFSKTSSSKECSDVIQNLINEFDATSLTVTDHNTTKPKLTTRQIYSNFEDGDDCWQGVVVFNFNITNQS